MTDEKLPKAETKRPRKRNAAGAKAARPSKAKASDVGSPATETPATEAPVAEIVHVDVPASEPPIEEKTAADVSMVEPPVVQTPATEVPVAEVVSEEEILKARAILRSNGYWLIPYGKIFGGIARFLGAGVDLVKRGFRGLYGWFSKKCKAMKAWNQERKRAAAERKLQADDEAARRAELLKSELRLAELRVEEARLKAAVATVSQPVAEPVKKPAAEEVESDAAPSADSGVSKCIACGAELVPRARFCRKCGKPVASSVQSL